MPPHDTAAAERAELEALIERLKLASAWVFAADGVGDEPLATIEDAIAFLTSLRRDAAP